MTHTDTFDEAAARAWLEGPDEEEPGYTVASELGVDEDFGFESDSWPYRLEDLVGKAVDAKLLPEGTLLWLTCSGEGLDGALITRTYDNPSMKLCSSFLELSDLIDDRSTMGIDNAVSVLSAIHLLASWLTLPGPKKAEDPDPATFTDTESLCAVVEVDVFRIPGETRSIREWAEAGWEAVRDLTAPVIALRNHAGEEIIVDLEDEPEANR